jgi:hypothetical protein
MLRQRFHQAVWLAFLGLMVGGVMWSIPALGQAPRSGPCFEDVQKLCPDAKTARERAQCLQSHKTELSPACQEQQERARARVTAIKEACTGDAERLCKDVTPGGGRMAGCLQAHKAELSAACKDALPKGRGKSS